MTEVSQFRRRVWSHYKKLGRHELPWRPPSLKLRRDKKNDFVYKILVSEVMLQQTQVERVVPFYKKFIKKFPTAKRLASALLSSVLQMWQGLGYNRRAKQLQTAAGKLITSNPRTSEELQELQGVGPYTACAIAAFAFNQDVVVIETNIRTAVIHHFFRNKKKVSDKEIEKILEQALPKGKSREWYSALMDYGAHLKRSGISHNTKSKKYVKQSKFAGSLREARGAILRALARKAASLTALSHLLGDARRVQVRTALRALSVEGLVKKRGENYVLAD